jgi:hypothetical protein
MEETCKAAGFDTSSSARKEEPTKKKKLTLRSSANINSY